MTIFERLNEEHFCVHWRILYYFGNSFIFLYAPHDRLYI